MRRAQPGDARALVALQRSIYREERWFVGDGPPGVDAVTRRLRGADPSMSLYLVAGADPVEEHGLAGWLELHRMQPDRLRHVAVLTLAVAASRRRQGVGRALLRRAYRWGRAHEVEKISLNVRARNEGALALYESEGFGLEGRERAHIRLDDGYEDNLIMAKFLRGVPGDA